jgi:hypothetical protein
MYHIPKHYINEIIGIIEYHIDCCGIFIINHTIYSVSHQYLNKFSNGFWDNQWFGRNQIYLKLKLETLQFMPGIKNLNLKIIILFFLIGQVFFLNIKKN